jgi:hypothetical protein
VIDLGTRTVIWFGVVWFGTEAFDVWLPPYNPTFNAALALAASIACLARGLER